MQIRKILQKILGFAYKRKIDTSAMSMTLIGHLQVLDVPLVSLYYDGAFTNEYFLAVKLFGYDEKEDITYLFYQTTIEEVLEYMNGNFKIIDIACNGRHKYKYEDDGEKNLHFHKLIKIPFFLHRDMWEYKGCDDSFNKHQAYKSVGLKRYLREQLEKQNKNESDCRRT